MKQKNSVMFSSTLIYLISLTIFVVIRILVLLIDFNLSDDILDLITTSFVQIGIMFLLPILLFSKMQKQKISKTFKDFNYNKLDFSSIMICFLIGFLVYFLNIAIASFFNSIIHLFGYENSPSLYSTEGENYGLGYFFYNVLLIAILPAICEENMHRGLLLNGFSKLGIKKTLILSSLLFGLMHLNINQFFYASILGFVMGFSVVISKSIVPAMIIHFMNNFLNVYFSFAINNHWFGENIYKFVVNFLYSENFISFFITAFFMLFLLLMAIVFLFTLLLKNTRLKKVKNMLNDIESINKEYNFEGLTITENQSIPSLYNLNNLVKEYNIKSLGNLIFTNNEIKSEKMNIFEKIMLVSVFVIGGLITAFTFIWGLL